MPVKVAAWLSVPAVIGALTVAVHTAWLHGHFGWLIRAPEVFLLAAVPSVLSLPASLALVAFASSLTWRRALTFRRGWDRQSGWVVWTLAAVSLTGTTTSLAYWDPASWW